MKCGKLGFEIKRPEMTCLLAFAGEGRDFGVVYLRVPPPGGKLHAAASDGKSRVWCENTSDAPKSMVGEYTISREFLAECSRICEADVTHIALQLDGKGLQNAVLVNSETGKAIREFKTKEQVTATQLTLAKLGEMTPFDPQTQGGSWFAVNPKKLAGRMNALSRATDGCPVTQYPPRSPEDLFQLEARAEGGHWRAVLAPERVAGPGDQGIDRDDRHNDDQARAPRPGTTTTPATPARGGKGKRKAQPGLFDHTAETKAPKPETNGAAAETGIVDDAYAERLKAEQQGGPPEVATSRKRKVKAKAAAKAAKTSKVSKKASKRRAPA